MTVNLQQFHQTFFDESAEGLTNMEAALLALERRGLRGGPGGEAEREAMHAMFRVVHSIKGGSGTFGFGWISDFSHLLETTLDDLREGRRVLDKEIIVLLLRSVDCLRTLLDAARTDSTVDNSVIEEVTLALEDLHRGTTPTAPQTRAGPESSGRGWRIVFRPARSLFRRGNDPLRILRELACLGVLRVRAETGALPDWHDLDPESCYLGWELELEADVPRTMVDEVFAWVADEASLDIAPLAASAGERAAMADGEPARVRMRGTSLRVSTQKVDALMDTVGELVITQTMLQQIATQFTAADLPRLLTGLAQLERNVRELQDSVMSVRLLPLAFVFSRLPRVVRDIAERLGKRVELRVSGEHTELDKTLIERIGDPLMHMVRNAMDHAIETPEERRAARKPETGTIRIEAQQKGGSVSLEIEDDGRGLDYDKVLKRAVAHGLVAENARLSYEQLNELFFLPGMTTSESVTDLSGRGVGLDVVRSNIRSLGGHVEVNSRPGQGTRFTIRLPLTLAIMDGLGLQVGEQTYVLPLAAITESVRLGAEDLQRLPDGAEVFALRKEYLPLMRLHELFGVAPCVPDVTHGTVVVIEADGARAGLFVDDILGQQQVVIKSLEAHYRRVEGVAAATILGDGTVALILDAGGLIRLAHARVGARLWPVETGTTAAAPGAAFH